MGANWGIN